MCVRVCKRETDRGRDSQTQTERDIDIETEKDTQRGRQTEIASVTGVSLGMCVCVCVCARMFMCVCARARAPRACVHECTVCARGAARAGGSWRVGLGCTTDVERYVPSVKGARATVSRGWHSWLLFPRASWWRPQHDASAVGYATSQRRGTAHVRIE